MPENVLPILLGIAAAIALLLMFYYKLRQADNVTLTAAIDALKELAQQNQPNALIEKAMTSVVPRETLDKVIDKINTGSAFVEQFTPDQIDALIEVLRSYTTSLIDGKPNDTAAPKSDAAG